MELHEVRNKLKLVLVARFELGVDAGMIANGEAIFDGGLGLDSMAAIELIIGIEEAFGIPIEDEDLTIQNFATVDTAARLIKSRLPVRGNGD